MSDIKERLRQRTADYVEHICSRPTDHEALEAADEIERLERELAKTRRENDWLRAYTGQSAKACVYCGLGADEQGKCERGFPGCARADDQMLCREVGVAIERDEARAALAEAQRDAERYRLMRRNPTVDGKSLVVVEVLEFNEDGPTDVYYAHAGDPLDAAIDAAIAKEQSHASE